MSCASLRCACQEASANLGILATRLRAGLPLPSGPCHCAQRCRKSSAAAGVPATAEPECRGVGPDWGSEKSACARNAIGAQSGVDTRQKINKIRATLRSRLQEQRVAIGLPLRRAPSKSARGHVFSDFNITRRCSSRMIIGSVLFVPPQRPLVTTKSFLLHVRRYDSIPRSLPGRADWPHAADAGRGTGLRGEVERRTNGFLAIELNRLGDASHHA
jgi:hypothetical protein